MTTFDHEMFLPINDLARAFDGVVGAHCPSDVLVGLGLGIAVALVGWPIARHPPTKGLGSLSTSRLRSLVVADGHAPVRSS